MYLYFWLLTRIQTAHAVRASQPKRLHKDGARGVCRASAQGTWSQIVVAGGKVSERETIRLVKRLCANMWASMQVKLWQFNHIPLFTYLIKKGSGCVVEKCVIQRLYQSNAQLLKSCCGTRKEGEKKKFIINFYLNKLNFYWPAPATEEDEPMSEPW